MNKTIISIFVLLVAIYRIREETLHSNTSANRCRCRSYNRSMLRQYCSLRSPPRCPGGTQKISDMCQCCQVCPKMVGQSCFGPYGVLGACKSGLTCTSRKGNPIPYTFGLTPRGRCRN